MVDKTDRTKIGARCILTDAGRPVLRRCNA